MFNCALKVMPDYIQLDNSTALYKPKFDFRFEIELELILTITLKKQKMVYELLRQTYKNCGLLAISWVHE